MCRDTAEEVKWIVTKKKCEKKFPAPGGGLNSRRLWLNLDITRDELQHDHMSIFYLWNSNDTLDT